MTYSLPIIRINGEEYYVDERLGEARPVARPYDRIPVDGHGGSREYRYWFNEIQHFIDRRVVTADLQLEDGQWFPFLTFEDGSGVILLCDAEGNGPGRFRIIEEGQ